MDTTPPPDAAADAPDGAGAGLFETSLHSLPLIARGKVRDNYAVGDDRILMVASDRISAFDVVMNEPIPGKGRLLTEMALFWFDKLKHIVPNHLTGDDPESVVAPDEREQVRGRSMLVKRLTPLPIEAVVRGYLAGSGWKEYQASGTVCGVPLPPGLQLASKLPAPIFTPATKAEAGHHDENIDFARASELVGAERAAEVRDVAIRLYNEAAAYALTRGIVIADTKFEFGLDEHDRLVLMDEVLTPDSSRYWPIDGVVPGRSPPSYDKQVLRDWLEAVRIDDRPWPKAPPAPALDPAIADRTQAIYAQVRDVLTRADEEPTYSAQIAELERTIAEAVDPLVADGLRADHVIALARSGRQREAEENVLELRRRRESSPHPVLTARLNFAEAVVDRFGQRLKSADDKLKRAHLLAIACKHDDLQALCAAWIAHYAWNDEDVGTAARFARESLAVAHAENHPARARASLLLAEILGLSGRDDLAHPWALRAQTHTSMLRDWAAKSALAFNLATVKLMQLRQQVLNGIVDGDRARLAVEMRRASSNSDAAFGIRDEIMQFQHAQLCSLLGHTEEALKVFLRTIAECSEPIRERSVWLADTAWCFSRLGRNDEAIRASRQAVASIHVTTQIDDLASVHSMLADVHRRAGDDAESNRLAALARQEWATYEAFQRRCVELCEDISENG